MSLFKVTPNVNFPNKIEITENRAPTDECIKLYKEMEEKIYASVSKSLYAKGNHVEFTIAFTQDYIMQMRVHLKIKVNDVEYTHQIIPSYEQLRSPELLLNEVTIWCAEKIIGKSFYESFMAFTAKNNKRF